MLNKSAYTVDQLKKKLSLNDRIASFTFVLQEFHNSAMSMALIFNYFFSNYFLMVVFSSLCSKLEFTWLNVFLQLLTNCLLFQVIFFSLLIHHLIM